MQKIFNIVSQLKEYVILIVLLLISIILLAVNDNAQIKTIRSYTLVVIGVAQKTMAVVPNIFELQKENEYLRKKNVVLLAEVSRLRELKNENIHLRELLSFKEKSNFELISGDVIAKSLNLLRNTITLDIGEKDGVRVDMPIISDRGIVGRVIALSSSYAVGQLLFNKDFRTSVKIQRSRVDGILTWEGGNFLVVRNVSKKQDVQIGDLVITSGYSRIFPPIYSVGTVTAINDNPASLFKDIKVVPHVDFTRLEQVFVVKTLVESERVEIETKVDKK